MPSLGFSWFLAFISAFTKLEVNSGISGDSARLEAAKVSGGAGSSGVMATRGGGCTRLGCDFFRLGRPWGKIMLK